MILHSKLLLGHLSDPLGSPNLSTKTERLGTPSQQVGELRSLLRTQFGRSARRWLMLQGLNSLFPGFLKPLAHCPLCYSKGCCDVFLFPSLFMQFPRLHPSLFAPIFARGRFLVHSSFYRIAQFRTLVFSAGIYNDSCIIWQLVWGADEMLYFLNANPL